MKITITDFHALLTAVVEELGEYKVYHTLKRDKHTLKRWLAGGQPDDPRDEGSLIRLALHNGIDVADYQTFSPIYNFSSDLSYMDNMFAGPPDLQWLWDRQDPPPAYRSSVGAIEIDCPIGIASGPLMGSDKYAMTMLDLGFGLSTFKTRRANAKDGWPRPQIAFVLQPPALLDERAGPPPEVLVSFRGSDVQGRVIPDIVNSMGVPSEAAAVWQKAFENIRNHPRGKYVGLSVIGEDTVERSIKRDLQDAIARALEMAPPFVEINISCPNLKGKDLHSDSQMLREICAAARQQVKQKSLLFLKLPCVSGARLLSLLRACGDLVDAMVFKNTIKVRPVLEDRDKGKIGAFLGREFGGLSGPSTFPLTLRGVREIAKLRQQLGQKFAIIAVGGVQTTADVGKLMEAGASAVQAVTTPMFDPLLAFKVRYGLRELRDKTQAARAIADSQAELLLPRNLTEWNSLAEASQAAVDAGQKVPGFNFGIPAQKWNLWRQAQPSQPPGHGQRLSVRRRIDWFRDFTS